MENRRTIFITRSSENDDQEYPGKTLNGMLSSIQIPVFVCASRASEKGSTFRNVNYALTFEMKEKRYGKEKV